MITDVNVVDVATGTLRPGMTVAIDAGRVTRIVATGSERLEAERTLDGAGRYLMPGLCDLHTHWTSGAVTQPDDPGAALLPRHLYYGVTQVLNLGSAGGGTDYIDDLRARRASGQIEGPHIHAAGAMLTVPGSHPIATLFRGEEREQAQAILDAAPPGPVRLDEMGFGITLVRDEDEVRAEVQRLLDWGADVIKVVVESGPDPFGDDHPQMSQSMVEAAVATARPAGVPVVVHISTLDELQVAVDAGASAIAHAEAPSTPDAVPSAELLAQMAADGFTIISTLGLYEGMGRYGADPSELQDPFLRETLSDADVEDLESLVSIGVLASQFEHGGRVTPDAIAHVGAAHAAGVPVLAGTDTGVVFRFPGYALHEELALLVEAGLTAADALRSATADAAAFLGEQDEWGRVEEGMAADLVLLDADPLADIRATRSIREVVIDGRVVDRSSLVAR